MPSQYPKFLSRESVPEAYGPIVASGSNKSPIWAISDHAVKSVPEELADFGGIPDYRKIAKTLPQPASWFVFADFLIYSAAFAIRLSAGRDDAPVLWIGDGTTHNVVANSFSSFLDC
jgi:hypothetical protein